MTDNFDNSFERDPFYTNPREYQRNAVKATQESVAKYTNASPDNAARVETYSQNTPALSAKPDMPLLAGLTAENTTLEGIANGALTAVGIAGAVAGAAAAVIEKLVVKPMTEQEQQPVIVAPAQKPPELKTAILQPTQPRPASIAPVAKAA